MFSRFFKKKPSPEPEMLYPYSETVQEMAGTDATNRKRTLEARQQTLESLATQVRPLNEHEQTELNLIRQQIASLLQVDTPPAHLTGSGPLLAPTRTAAAEYSDWVDQGPAPARILLIEDDPDMNALLDYMLQHHRFEVQLFTNGKLARDWILSNEPPDLISLDIMLPNCDGLELVATIRRQPRWEKVPIVMLTSKSDEPTVQRALSLGANEFMYKPFQPEEYMARIKRLLAER
jgi:PleD family two-component response regulator